MNASDSGSAKNAYSRYPVPAFENGTRQISRHLDSDAELFHEFPHELLTVPFARLDLAAGELPQTAGLPDGFPARHEHPCLTLNDRCDRFPAYHGLVPGGYRSSTAGKKKWSTAEAIPAIPNTNRFPTKIRSIASRVSDGTEVRPL